jgi:hypothetical protein
LSDTLHSERAWVQREIVQYSTLTRAALESTKIIDETLTPVEKGRARAGPARFERPVSRIGEPRPGPRRGRLQSRTPAFLSSDGEIAFKAKGYASHFKRNIHNPLGFGIDSEVVQIRMPTSVKSAYRRA